MLIHFLLLLLPCFCLLSWQEEEVGLVLRPWWRGILLETMPWPQMWLQNPVPVHDAEPGGKVGVDAVPAVEADRAARSPFLLQLLHPW